MLFRSAKGRGLRKYRALPDESFERDKVNAEASIEIYEEIAEQIKTARAFGDLSENAEYDAAKIEQARIEYEIVEIEAMLKNVVLIDEDTLNTNVVDVGSNVTVKMLSAGGEERTFQIVGSAEANPYENRISNESPVGKTLLGHKVGELVEIQTPDGVSEFEITAIGK